MDCQVKTQESIVIKNYYMFYNFVHTLNQKCYLTELTAYKYNFIFILMKEDCQCEDGYFESGVIITYNTVIYSQKYKVVQSRYQVRSNPDLRIQ